ncbi:hypothetical protein ABZ946_11825 [Streptomyces sp. NPDC046324]|uniref:hypothetical protein n=1 Tax=Streptomyces sp. NPDC046324 TaxID=3154915 RepID=UPI00340354C8
MFWARQHLITPKDLKEWWPDWEKQYHRVTFSNRLRKASETYGRWSDIARVAYGIGILCLLSGLTVLMVPAEGVPTSAWRWAAVIVGVLATLGELIWVGVSFVPERVRRKLRRKLGRRRPKEASETETETETTEGSDSVSRTPRSTSGSGGI